MLGGSGTEKRVLMIAFHFPPEGGSGTQRTLKFAHYLPGFGWNVEVLTVRPEAYELLDPSLIDEIPASVRVHRTFCIDPRKHLSIFGRYPGFLNFLDRYIYWFPFGLWRALRLLRKRRFDVIYSTSPTRTAHLIAYALSRLSGVPWVCDFRDPWLDDDSRKLIASLLGNRVYIRILEFLERLLFRQAAHLIANTSSFGKEIAAHFGKLVREKLSVVPNGYDEGDFRGVLPAPRTAGGDCLVFLHTGEVYPGLRDPRPFLDIVESLLREGALQPADIQIRFLGAGSSLESADFRQWLASRKVRECVSVEPRMNHRGCIAQALAADVLLLLQCTPITNMQIPAKAFEYLRTGKSILALAPLESASAQLIVSCNAGWVADTGDPEGMRNCLMQILRRKRSSMEPRSPVGQFERSHLARQLSSILDKSAFGKAVAGLATLTSSPALRE